MTARRVLLVLAAAAGALRAHTGEPLEPHDFWTAWRFDPGVCLPLLLTALLYARGICRAQGIPSWQITLFWTGLGTLALALISPLHPLGEVLFSAHMLQHEILMLVAAPLLVLSRPLVPLLWGLPFEGRRTAGRWSKHSIVHSVWRGLTVPAVAWFVHGVVLWVWHAPRAFEATLTSDWIHAAQHVSFFGSALLFWWSLFYSRPAHSHGIAVLYLFTTAVHTSILGALLTFGHTVWYPAYTLTAPQWGLSPLEDQQIGGLIMWVPGGLVYLAASLGLFTRWLGTGDVLIQRSPHAT